MAFFLAQTVTLVHFVFVIFVALGGFVALKWPRAVWAHLPAAVWGMLIEFGVVWCPLTPLEKSLLLQSGRPSYDTGFIAHHVMPLIYPPGLTPTLQRALGIGLVLLNAVLYAVVWRRYRRNRPQPRP